MISVWWVLVAFVGGGCAGVLVMALMRMSADLPEQSMQELDRTRPQVDQLEKVDGFRHDSENTRQMNLRTFETLYK
jgi:Cys-tRNA synthase (O-phospho-L-seryl-tRNA:Cys-tRNA synthase)